MRRIRNLVFVVFAVILGFAAATPLFADFYSWQSAYGCSTWLHSQGSYTAQCDPGHDPMEFCWQAEAACADFCGERGGVGGFGCDAGGLAGCNCVLDD
jgi:hypothetical protein